MITELGQEQAKRPETKVASPTGMTFLPNIEAKPEDVKKLAQVIAGLVPPAQRDIIKKVFDLE